MYNCFWKIFFKHYFYYSPRGLLLDYNNKKLLKFFVDNIKQFLKERDGLIFKIDPLIEYRKHDKNGDVVDDNFNNQKIIDNLKSVGFKHHGFTKGYSGDIQFRWSYVLNLDASHEEIMDDMSQRCRRCIRKSYNYPIQIEYLNNENKYDFISVRLYRRSVSWDFESSGGNEYGTDSGLQRRRTLYESSETDSGSM